MIKIFQLIRSIHLGGAEIVAFNLAEYCNIRYADKLKLTVVEVHKTHDKYSIEKRKELNKLNIRIISLGTNSKIFSLLIDPIIFSYYLLKEKPDIIHSHTDLPDLVLSNTKRIFSFLHIKFPHIVRTIHNTVLWPTHLKLGKFTEIAFVNDSVVAVSEGALESYTDLRLKNTLSLSSNQQIIPNGSLIPGKKDHPFMINKEKINIAFCGRFEKQKGIDILIERVKVINGLFKEVFLFHFIGSGSYTKEVIQLAKEDPNVLVYETIPNISEKLYAFDFLIMPSRFEGLVLISIEASFSKVPVIASFAPGLSETLPSDWPLQFQLENEDELITIFKKIKNNEYDLEYLKNEAFLFVTEKFSHSSMIDSYAKLYMEILE